MGSDPNDFTDLYNTKLTPDQEKQFLKAYPNPHDNYDYDMRGAWLAGAAKAGNGHFPDTFKKPNHPTFSKQSQYSGKDGYTGGEWTGQDGGPWTYTASPTNLQFYPLQQLQDYFKRVEPTSQLIVAPVAPKGLP